MGRTLIGLLKSRPAQCWSSGICFFLLFTLSFLPSGWTSPALLGLSPDNSEALVLKAINTAESSIFLNIYQFDHVAITQALARKIRTGIPVQILLEGQPMGGISTKGKTTLKVLQQAIDETPRSDSKIFIMKSAAPSTSKSRRYRFNHAKYIVIDDAKCMISSENFTATGQAAPGKIGNRGWTIFLDDVQLAKELLDIFNQDLDPQFGDVTPYSSQATLELSMESAPSVPAKRTVPAVAFGTGFAESIQLITSPNALDELKQVMRQAISQLAIETMSFPPNWYKPSAEVGKPSQPHTNPLISEMIAAARRGIQVRALLNDDRAFSNQPPASGAFPNDLTVNLLNKMANCHQLPLEGRIVNREALEITYVHNKGILVDNDRTLISSINYTQNSIVNNRETAVLVQGQDINQYYMQVFDLDWNASASQTPEEPTSPLPLMNLAECPPLDSALGGIPLPFSLPSF